MEKQQEMADFCFHQGRETGQKGKKIFSQLYFLHRIKENFKQLLLTMC